MITQQMYKERQTPGPARPDYPCGTRQRYQGSRLVDPCRCRACQEANALYTRARRARRTVEDQAHYENLPDDPVRLHELNEYDYTMGGLLP